MRALAALAVVLAALTASTSSASVAASAATCDPRLVVEDFIAALNAGDVERVDRLFAQPGEGWNWYSVGDRAGRRLGDEATRRTSLLGYFASRVQQHERLQLVRFSHNGNGNFGLQVRRRADDLRGRKPVVRMGKGWVVCETGLIGVWSLGGAPPPREWGSCPRNAVPISKVDLATARRVVHRFVRDVFSEMSPSLDVQGVEVTEATLAPGIAKGYAARVKCGRSVQARTAVVSVRFPRVARVSECPRSPSTPRVPRGAGSSGV